MGRVAGCPGFICVGTGLSDKDDTLMCFHSKCQPGAEYLLAIRREIKAGRLTFDQVKNVFPTSIKRYQDRCSGWKLATVESAIQDAEVVGVNFLVQPNTKRPHIYPCDHGSCDFEVYWKCVVISLVARGEINSGYLTTIYTIGWAKRIDEHVASGGNPDQFIEDCKEEPITEFLWHPTLARIIKR